MEFVYGPPSSTTLLERQVESNYRILVDLLLDIEKEVASDYKILIGFLVGFIILLVHLVIEFRWQSTLQSLRRQRVEAQKQLEKEISDAIDEDAAEDLRQIKFENNLRQDLLGHQGFVDSGSLEPETNGDLALEYEIEERRERRLDEFERQLQIEIQRQRSRNRGRNYFRSGVETLSTETELELGIRNSTPVNIEPGLSLETARRNYERKIEVKLEKQEGNIFGNPGNGQGK